MKIKYIIAKFLYTIPYLRKKYLKAIIEIDVKYNKDGVEARMARSIAYHYYNTKIGDWCNGVNTFGLFNKVKAPVEIGNYSVIAENSVYWGANHPLNNISCSAVFFDKRICGKDKGKIDKSYLNIGHDVWVGTNVVITANCHIIGNGAIIGAGSIVTKDVEPYSIVAGNPATILRYRFSENEIMMLEDSKWWKLSPKELMKFEDNFSNPTDFFLKVKEYYDNK